jgi:hypothetical protein
LGNSVILAARSGTILALMGVSPSDKNASNLPNLALAGKSSRVPMRSRLCAVAIYSA